MYKKEKKSLKKIEYESEDESDDSKVNISVELPEIEFGIIEDDSSNPFEDEKVIILKRKYEGLVNSLKNSIKELTKERDAAESSVFISSLFL